MRCSSLNIGIDVGGTNLRAGIVDESGRLLSQEQIPIGNFESPEAFVRKLAALTERALDTAHAAVSDIGSIYLQSAFDGCSAGGDASPVF